MSSIPTSLRPFEHVSRRYQHTPEFERTPKDVVNPDYWTHVAKQLRPGDEIVVVAADMSWRMELLVRDVNRISARMNVISLVDFDEQPAVQLSEEDIQQIVAVWRGPTHKFCAVRKDGEVVKTGFATKADTMQWISNHIRAQAA